MGIQFVWAVVLFIDQRPLPLWRQGCQKSYRVLLRYGLSPCLRLIVQPQRHEEQGVLSANHCVYCDQRQVFTIWKDCSQLNFKICFWIFFLAQEKYISCIIIIFIVGPFPGVVQKRLMTPDDEIHKHMEDRLKQYPTKKGGAKYVPKERICILTKIHLV